MLSLEKTFMLYEKKNHWFLQKGLIPFLKSINGFFDQGGQYFLCDNADKDLTRIMVAPGDAN